MTRHCMAREQDACLQIIAATGLAICPEPLCEKDWTRPSLAEELAQVQRVYPADVHPDVAWLAGAVLRVLDVVAAHEAAAEGQPLGWAADIRNAIEGDL